MSKRDRWGYEECEEDRGGNDEYYIVYCASCGKRTEHDACTGECVSC